MKTFSIAALATIAASAASANPFGDGTPVPEISAMEGTAALVAVAAVLLIAFERRRRAS
ncbi:hypothetical protein [Jannaschia sp. LMIT008]|uniref:hypothetical protein n=1 Tax=Jannaschia maritima TaxID=3032585 RepID=UPI002811AF5E|nr:hypothetical protein [Jannaschia sp. LMIT008]